MPNVKPRHNPPFGCGGRVPTLIVRHPHYPNFNTLVKLPALDEGGTVNYNVALVICGIIADNSWTTGWFARSNDGSDVCEKDIPLRAAHEVFYFVGKHSYKYPVYLSWDHWRIPKTDLDLPLAFSNISIDPPPPSFRNGGYMEDLKSRDQSCRISGIIDGCDQAHLVPAGEREWWDSNIGEISDLEIESALNGILLRTDLHRSFDSGTWIPMVTEGSRLVMYIVRTADVSNQFLELWHGTEMQQLVGIDRRCLFARVAWAVLSLHHEFLGIRRLASDNLLVRLKDGDLKEMAPEVFRQFSRSRSRKPSPTKRPRLQGLEEEGGIIVAADLGWCDEIGDEDTAKDRKESGEHPSWLLEDDGSLYHRGRKRLRTIRPPNLDHTGLTAARPNKKHMKSLSVVPQDILTPSLVS